MIHLRLRTEYSFRRAYGRPEQVLAALSDDARAAAAITDNATWGLLAWRKACKSAGVRPLLGVEINVVPDIDAKFKKRTVGVDMAFIARNELGLREIYKLMSRAHDNFHWVPRLSYRDVNRVSDNVVVLTGAGADIAQLVARENVYLELSAGAPALSVKLWRAARESGSWQTVATCDAYYPRADDRAAYEVIAGREIQRRSTPMHLLSADEIILELGDAGVPADVVREALLNTERIAAGCEDYEMPKASMVRAPRPDSLYNMCISGAAERGLPLKDGELADAEYQARLVRELDMIAEKQFEDYFYVIADLVAEAKKEMLVGPARGSSAGSLACYLLGITDVDPMPHGLMFERFIDVTRADLPDIDIDFPDTRRDLVITQLQKRYGARRVGRIGNVLTYKAKSCISATAMSLGIPPWETTEIKDQLIERSSGDARAQFAVLDAFNELDVGKRFLEKYPAMRVAADIEGHATGGGTHAAGVIVSEEPVTAYCAVDRSGTAMINKKTAEALNVLKIDVLGLRTLSVLQDCLDQIGHDRDWLVNLPLDDKDAFELLSAERYSGIFQFEGYALQSLTRQMKVTEFNDIVAITALARPGPLHTGAATSFIERRTGAASVTHLHPLIEPITRETYGEVVYQEQVMNIGRLFGDLSWEDVSELRKAMSRSLGEEFFNQYWVKFRDGAARVHGIDEGTARRVWDRMCTFGSWAFNKSHAVSYALISYWCAYLKAKWPLEYAAACLRNSKDQDQVVQILRDITREGYIYRPVDPERSDIDWTVRDGELLGGLTNIKGMGPKKAADVLRRRALGQPLQPGQLKMLTNPVTPFDNVWECETRFKALYDEPAAGATCDVNGKPVRVTSGRVQRISEIGTEPGEYVLIGRIAEKNLRDLNEYGNLAKRGGRLVKRDNLFLNLWVEDDTGRIMVKIDRYRYSVLGKPIVEEGKVGDYYLFKGNIKADGWRMIECRRWRKLT